MKTESLKLDSITVIPAIQQRAGGLDSNLVEEYRVVWRELTREKRPWKEPPVVFRAGKDKPVYILAGGFHRYEAGRLEGVLRTTFEVRPGTEIDALKFALGDNTEHGRKRTPADLRKAITSVLNHPELQNLSDRKAAELVRCDSSYFSRMKREITGKEPDEEKASAAKSGHEKREREKVPFDDPVMKTPAKKTDDDPENEDDPQEETVLMNGKCADSPHKGTANYLRDSFGRVVPGWLHSVFQSNVRDVFEMAKKSRDQIARRGQSFAEGLIARAIKELASMVPHAVCPKCCGHGCEVCRHKGWVSPPEFDAMPAKMKSIARAFDPKDRGEVDEEAERALAATVKPPEGFAVVRDVAGTAVPKKLRDAFSDTSMPFAVELLKEAGGILRSVNKWNAHLPDMVVAKLMKMTELVESSMPNLLCDQCEGKGCKHCHTSGFQPVSFGG